MSTTGRPRINDEQLARSLAIALAAHPNATMDELASAAGVSRATLFRRYPTQQALLVHVSEVATSCFVEGVNGAQLEQGAEADALLRLCAVLADLAPQFGLLVLHPIPTEDDARLTELAAPATTAIQALITRGQQSGVFRSQAPAEWLATMLEWTTVAAASRARTGAFATTDEITDLLAQTAFDLLQVTTPR